MEGPRPDPLTRYQALQVVSIILILVGLAAAGAALAVDAALFTRGQLPDDRSTLIPLLATLVAGGIGLMAGLAMNAVRSVVVREALPPERYRGPSIIVLVLLATALTSLASISLTDEATALFDVGPLSVAGSLLLLTITQLGLLGTAGLFVAVPHALEGVRFRPRAGWVRHVAIGIGLGVPAWLVAEGMAVAITRLLTSLGVQPELDLAGAAMDRAEPWVLVLAIVIVAPIAEEIFFRGVAFNAWEREYGTRRAVIGTATLFALIHGSIFALGPIFVLGLLLALVYRQTRSLPATIALHATFNLISVTLALLVRFEVITWPLPT